MRDILMIHIVESCTVGVSTTGIVLDEVVVEDEDEEESAFEASSLYLLIGGGLETLNFEPASSAATSLIGSTEGISTLVARAGVHKLALTSLSIE